MGWNKSKCEPQPSLGQSIHCLIFSELKEQTGIKEKAKSSEVQQLGGTASQGEGGSPAITPRTDRVGSKGRHRDGKSRASMRTGRCQGPKGHPFFFFILQRMQTSKSSHFTDQTTQSGRLCGWVTEPIWLTKEAWARAPARDEDIWEKKESRWPRLTLSKSCETQWNTKGGKQKQSIQSLEVLSLNDFTVYMIIYTCRYNFLKIKPTWKIN